MHLIQYHVPLVKLFDLAKYGVYFCRLVMLHSGGGD